MATDTQSLISSGEETMNEEYAAIETDSEAEKAIYDIICKVYEEAPPNIVHDRKLMKKRVDDTLTKKFGIKLLDLIVDEQPRDGGKLRCRFWTYGPRKNLIGIFV